MTVYEELQRIGAILMGLETALLDWNEHDSEREMKYDQRGIVIQLCRAKVESKEDSGDRA